MALEPLQSCSRDQSLRSRSVHACFGSALCIWSRECGAEAQGAHSAARTPPLVRSSYVAARGDRVCPGREARQEDLLPGAVGRPPFHRSTRLSSVWWPRNGDTSAWELRSRFCRAVCRVAPGQGFVLGIQLIANWVLLVVDRCLCFVLRRRFPRKHAWTCADSRALGVTV